MRVGSSGLDVFNDGGALSTALEARYKQERLMGIADAMRELQGANYQRAHERLVLKWPEAVCYTPFGSRPGEEEKPELDQQIEYRDGAVMYWAPENYGTHDQMLIIEWRE
jgi:hypothetical protein